ncbi:MAG: SsrA-binding protein SmpB [Verrucomicrobia bacterium]|nr:SsrA-binding protein SmpB [Verrucomicrobiota bacterium]MBS0637256.1 SsrA-binding protein SmpB [Verrucomicrobiota bacterium]
MKDSTEIKELVSNRKAGFQYEILDTYEMGIVLMGTEIKSLRDHGGSLQEAYVTIDNGELWLVNASIAPYRFGSVYNHEDKRKRKLLAHKKEIIRLNSAIQEKGLTCIPLSIYLKKGRAKVKIAIAKGKKLHDKRDTIKEREDNKEMQRAMKNR